MPITAPVHSASPSAETAAIRPSAAPLPAAAASVVLSAREPVDLISLSALATRHLALAPPTESLRQLGVLLHDVEQIEQVVRTPSPTAMSELAVEIGAAADALATQLPRPVEAPPKADTHSDGQQPGSSRHGPQDQAAVLAEREQQLRDEAMTMLGSAADTLVRMQARLHGTPIEEAGVAARLAASAARVAMARHRVDGVPPPPPPPPPAARPRFLLAVVAVLGAVAGLYWASRLDLHLARIAAGAVVALCIAGWVWRRRPRWRRVRIEFRH